jgi:hypothetical protein
VLFIGKETRQALEDLHYKVVDLIWVDLVLSGDLGDSLY